MRILTWLQGLSAAGCTTPFRAPFDVAHIKLERCDSPVVRVEKVWLERKFSSLSSNGSKPTTPLRRTLMLPSTARCFSAPWIISSHGKFRGVTVRIEIRAHEGNLLLNLNYYCSRRARAKDHRSPD